MFCASYQLQGVIPQALLIQSMNLGSRKDAKAQRQGF